MKTIISKKEYMAVVEGAQASAVFYITENIINPTGKVFFKIRLDSTNRDWDGIEHPASFASLDKALSAAPALLKGALKKIKKEEFFSSYNFEE